MEDSTLGEIDVSETVSSEPSLDDKGSSTVVTADTDNNEIKPDIDSSSAKTEDVSIEPQTSNGKSSKIPDTDMLLAVTLVKDAKAGRNLHFKTDEKSIRAYCSHNHILFKIILYICLWGNLSLAIFEKPAVTGDSIPYWGTMIMEAVFLSYFIFRIAQNYLFSPPNKFIRDPKNITVMVIILLAILDMICYCLWINLAPVDIASKAVRWSRPLRPLLLINLPEGRQIRKAFRNIRRTLPDIAHVLVLFICSIALFSLMAMKLFQKRNFKYPDGKKYFDNYWDSFWDLYVLVTTANNPDVMMPAYDNSKWFALFFIVYLLVNLYIFMSIVLAVVYYNYKLHLKNEVKASVYLKRRLLGRAFDLLKEMKEDAYVVTRRTWHTLLNNIGAKRSRVQVDLLLYVLDDTGKEAINRVSFLKVADLLNVQVSELLNETTLFERTFPRFYLSRPSKFVIFVVKNRFFRYFFDFAILVNAFCIGFSWDKAEWFFLSLFTLEIFLKMYASGPVKYFKSFWNIFDFLVVFSAFGVTVVETILEQSDSRDRALDFILVLRVLRLIRLMGTLKKFQIVITTIVNIGPSILTYGGVIFVFLYIYAIIGMEIFNGLINYYGYENLNSTTNYCGNPKLNGTEFFIKRYCSNNFNDIFHSLVILFELMVVNQWHVLTQGYVDVTNIGARVYFISFHMICVTILLNIFTAFILEVFLLEYNLSKGRLETVIESRIKEMGLGEGQEPTDKSPFKKPKLDKQGLVGNMEEDLPMPKETATPAEENEKEKEDEVDFDEQKGRRESFREDTGLRFKLKQKTKNITMVLQHMFEGEIDPNDLGPGEDQDLDYVDFTDNKMTFDSYT